MDTEDILEQARNWHAAGDTTALATVVQSWGSSPRPVGSRMAVSQSGRMAGSVSGGCVEGAVVEEAYDVLATGRPRVVSYGISDEDAEGHGLTCGGTIRVFVELVDW